MMAENPATSSVAAESAAIDTAVGNSTSDSGVAPELGTSPTQERSSNSHPHDSEYDTASDLEGGGEYDDDDDDDDLEDSDISDEDDQDDDLDESDVERPSDGVTGSQEKVASEAEIQKKVDEDRSNPQYIPKRGTFYEHDDRMADGDGDLVLAIGDVDGPEGNAAAGTVNSKSSTQSPVATNSGKTMKKWQAASGVERWTHDRFDPNEQQPKSRSELISAYGYDIRTEEAPPRARRRRRYARGPSKYDRKWEDESAYVKANNKERKPPRASDFPALNERGPRKPRRENRDRDDEGRDEKENRPDRRRPALGGGGAGAGSTKSSVNDRLNIARSSHGAEERRGDREDLRVKINRNQSSRQQQQQSSSTSGVGRQAAMEFKQKNRNVKNSASYQNKNTQGVNRPDDRSYERSGQRSSYNQSNNYNNASQSNSVNEHYQQRSSGKDSHSSSSAAAGHAAMNNNHGNVANKLHEHSYQSHQQKQMMPQQQQQQQQQQNMAHMRQNMPPKATPTQPSNLSQRLQQVQNRNDPSHVGSVQMHALATQNQQHQQQQQQLVLGQQPNSNAMMMSAVAQQQQQQQQQLMQSQEQRGAPKRYSSMRRSQHDGPHLPEPHTQQLPPPLHMQQPPPPQQAQQPPPQALIMQDQHTMLPANILQQLYHQENLQVQMQALQVSQGGPAQQAKQPAYAPVPPTAAQAPPPYAANPANTAYFVTDAYGAAAAAGNPQAPPPAPQYATQQPTYLPPTAQATAAALGYTNPAPPSQNPIPAGPPAAVYPGGPAGPQPAPNANQNYNNYQNYNTVGGTTYFVPPAQTTSRPVVLPQRRPTNAIPILPPAEKNKQRNNDKDDSSKSSGATIDSSENIDHIIDNMFVQRPAFQPPQSSQSANPKLSESSTSNPGGKEVIEPSNDDAAVGTVAADPINTNASNLTSASAEADFSSNSNLNETNSNNNNPIATQE